MEDTPVQMFPSEAPASENAKMFPDEGTTAGSFPTHLANERADKLHIALGDKSPGYGQLVGSLSTTVGEEIERNRLSSEKDAEDLKLVRDKLGEMLRTKTKITPADMEQARALMTKTTDPDTVIERVIANGHVNPAKTVQELMSNMGATFNGEGQKAVTDMFYKVNDFVAKKEYAERLAQELEARIEDSTFAQKAGNFLGQAVPFLSWYRTQDSSKEGFLKGSNIKTQVQDYMFKDLEVGSKELKAKVDEIAAKNPAMALDFIRNFTDPSNFSKDLDNVMAGLDIATAPGLGLLKKAAKNLLSISPTNLAGRAQAVGAHTQATNIRAIDELRVRAQGQTSVQDFADLERVIPNVANPGAYLGNGSSVISPNGVARAVTELEQSSDTILKNVVTETNYVDRINPEVRNLMLQDNVRVFTARYDNTNGAIMNTRWIRGAEEGASNVDSLAIELGTPKAQPFATAELAKDTADNFYGLSAKDYTIKEVEEGAGFKIEVLRHVDENTVNTYTAMQLQNTANRANYIGMLGSADNFFAASTNAARKQTGYGISGTEEALRASYKQITSLRDPEFNQFIAHGRDNRVAYNTAQDMERAWFNMHNRLPTEQQVLDYAKVLQVHELDYTVRNLGHLAKKASQGFENHVLPLDLPTGKEPPRGFFFDTKSKRLQIGSAPKASNDNLDPAKSIFEKANLKAANDDTAFSGAFKQGTQKDVRLPGPAANDGRVESYTNIWSANDNQFQRSSISLEGKFLADGIPWDIADEFTIAVWNSSPNQTRYIYKNKFTNARRIAEMNDLVQNQGYKVIQMSPYARDAMRRLNLDMPEFLLVKDFKSERLSINQIPKVEGTGHVVYPENSIFIGQADVHVSTRGGTRNSSFVGNNNLHVFTDPNQAQAILPRLETARQYLVRNDIPGLTQYLVNNLPYSVDEFSKLFKQIHGNGRFDLEQPFQIRRMGENSFDSIKDLRNARGEVLYPNIRNYADSPLNPYNADTFTAFGQQRNEILTTIDGANAAFSMRPAELLNPKDALIRTAEDLIATRYLDDLKVKSVRDFVTNYQRILNVSLEEALRNPTKVLMNPPFKPGADPALVAQAKNYRRATMEFVGMDSQAVKDMKTLMARAYDSIFPEESLLRRGIDGFDELTGSMIKDPATWARRWAFRLSQINPDALLTQATQVINAVAIAGPTAGARGAGAMIGLKMLRNNESEQLLNMIANRYAKATGTSPEDYKAMYQAYKRSGFGAVGEEHTMAEGLGQPRVFVEGSQKAVDVGLTFFREGERVTREVAWASAFYQWRAANPTAKLTKQIENEILNKADIMAGSMSKASNATWSNGIASIPTQFLKYQFQLFEQIAIGKELTGAERARLFASQAVVWGIPVGAVGSVAGIYPWSDKIAEALRSRGIDTDNNKVTKVFNDGVASVLFEMATGDKYDVAGRFGPKGISVIKDYQSGRKDLVEILGGPSGKLIHDSLKTVGRAADTTWNMIFNTTDESAASWKPLADDIVKVMENAALGRKANELYAALALQKWIYKNRPNGIDGVTNTEAYIRAVSGLTPDRISEAMAQQDALMLRDQNQKSYEKEIMYLYRQVYANMDNPAAQEAYRDRINLLYAKGEFTTDERYRMIKRFGSEGRDTIESINRRYIQANPNAKPLVDKNRDTRQDTLEGNR